LEALVQTLIKKNDENKQSDETKLVNALASIPTISATREKKQLETSKSTSGTKVKMSKHVPHNGTFFAQKNTTPNIERLFTSGFSRCKQTSCPDVRR
jgi:hypothetical protein